jgi:hypothetical protein
MESQNTEPECDTSLVTPFEELGLQEDNQELENICSLTKNTKPEEKTLAAFAEFVLPEQNQELEKIVAAVEKGESTLEGGADKILKLAENVCDVDKILSTLTEEICKRTKSNAVPIFVYMAISEGLQHIFNIGSGAAKLDFTAIRYYPKPLFTSCNPF